MKKLFYAIALFGVLSMSGCALNQMVKLAKDQNLTVTPNPLEVHADSISFEMSADLPVKMLKKGKVYTLNTFYKYGDKEEQLEAVQFRSEDYPNADTQAPKTSKTYTMAYDPAMNPGTLEVEGVASDPKNNKFKESPRMTVAPGLITTSKLVQPVYYAAYADHGYNNQEELIPTKVDFFFDQGRSTLKYSEQRSERGQKLNAFIAAKNATRTVTITGTHSPEGAERINTKLAADRAAAIEAYYAKQMRRYDYKGMADSINFITKDVVQNWQAFKDSLAIYDGISSEEKSGYLDIVNGGGSFEEKEDQLQKLSTYRKVLKELYPKLRLAKTEILTVKEKKTDAEIAVLAKMIADGSAPADTLSEEELMYSATLTPSLKEKEAIYMAATKKSGSWNAHNNLGAVYVAMAIEGDDAAADKAQAQLEIAANKNATAQVHANLASVALMQGNAQKAKDHLMQASGLSGEDAQGVNGVKSATMIMLANYSEAVSAGSGATNTATNLFNKGLAQVLNKDYQNAITSFKEAASKDSSMGLAHYGAAIASARLGQDDGVIEHITAAVKATPSLKGDALQDLEFAKYVSNAAFTSALK